MTRLYRYIRMANTPIYRVFTLSVLALLMIAPGFHSASASTGGSPVPAVQSGTDLYLQSQFQRMQAGKKVSTDPSLVPVNFWNRPQANEARNAYRWPEFYFGLDSDRTDSNGNGLRECRIKIDLSGFNTSGTYDTGEVLTFENELRRTIVMYNAALENVGLEFLEVTDGTHHLVMEAAALEDGIVSQATLFGAWSGSSSVFQLRRDYPNFNAFLSLTDNGAPTALFRRPPGNPYAHIFSEGVFTRTDASQNSIFAFAISNIFLRELGHLVGLIEPSTAYLNASNSAAENYLIDWLAWPTVKGLPPETSSLTLGGEDFSKTNWSEVFMNSFMNSESLFYQIYPDITAPIKAFIAHYYARYDYGGAQTLLDEAILEHNTYSWLANGKAVHEVEDNDTMTQSMPVTIGQPILGALSSFDPAGSTMDETKDDTEDWYQIKFINADLGRELVCTTGHATSIDRDARIELYNSQGALIASSNDEEYAEVRYDVLTTGTHYVAVKRPANTEDLTVRDYLLSLFFSDGEPPFGPTPTPTPTTGPTATPTAISVPVLQGAEGENILGLGPVQALAYSPDGLSIVTAGGQGLILWSADTGAPTKRFGSHSDDVLSVVYSPNGIKLASCSRDGTAKVWDITSGTEILSVTGHTGAINAVAFSGGNDEIITCGNDKAVNVWDIQSGQLIYTYSAHRAAVTAVAVSPDGASVLTGSKDNSAQLWDFATGNAIRTFSGHLGAVQSVAFSPDGASILTGSLDTTAKVWDIQTGVEKASFKTGSVNTVDFSGNGDTIAVGGKGGAKLASMASGSFTKTLLDGTANVLSVGFSPNGTRIAVASGDNSVHVFDTVTGGAVQTLKGHTSVVNAVDYSSDSQHVVSSGDDNVVRIWNKTTGAIVRSFETLHNGKITAIAYSPDGSQILTGSTDGTAALWETASGEALRIFAGHSGAINAVAFSQDGTQVITASEDKKAISWTIATGKKGYTFQTEDSAIRTLDAIPNSNLIVLGDAAGILSEWNLSTGEKGASYDGLAGAVLSAAASADGTMIAGGYEDNRVRVWNLESKQLSHFFTGSGAPNAIAFSPVKPWILAAFDTDIQIHHFTQQYNVDTYKGHLESITSIAAAPDGRSFVSGSNDGTLRVWDIGDWVDATPTPTPTSTPTPTNTPTNTPTFTPTFTPTATPTFTPTPVAMTVPDNTIAVTDDLQTTEDLLGKTDLDMPSDKQLGIRWNIAQEGVTQYHIYVRTNDGDPVYIGISRDPSKPFFRWLEPQFGNFYSFVVYGLIPGSPSVRLTTEKRVFYQTADSPTPTPTKVPVFFDVPANTVVVTDNMWSSDDLTGSYDQDHINERALTIRWNIDAEDVADYHIYTRINNGDPTYLGRTNSPDIHYFNWKEPQFGNSYTFTVFGMIPGSSPWKVSTSAGISFLQTDESVTPTPTHVPVYFDVPANSIVVTDNIWSSENLTGSFDQDPENERFLTIRWNIEADDITDYHVYTRINNGDPVYLGQTGSPDITHFNWIEPQFNNRYLFIVYGIRLTPPFTKITADADVFYQSSSNPTPTKTPTPTATPTPTKTPVSSEVPVNQVYVTDDLGTTENLVGLFDKDPEADRALGIRWNVPDPAITDFHIYVRVNGSTEFYLGHTGSGDIMVMDWRKGGVGITTMFSDGPQFSNSYRFLVYGIRPGQSSTLAQTDSVVLFEQEGSELPTLTPTPSVTPTPQIAINSVIVADHPDDFFGLSNGEDYDISSNRELVVRWNFNLGQVIADYHIYVSINGGVSDFLGRTGTGNADYFEWKINVPRLNPTYWNGPEFGNTYKFSVYAVTESGNPLHYGPYTHKGPVKFLERVDTDPVE